MTEHPEVGSCDLPEDTGRDQRSRHHAFRREAFAWEGISPRVYKLGGGSSPGTEWRNVVRHTLIGGNGEPTAFQLRYFEIGPGGYSSLEKHKHVHSIVVLRGRGQAIVGREVFTVSPFDLVYVPPGVPHQFVNNGGEPFGFLCPVDAERDPPQALSEAELRLLLDDPRIREAIRIHPVADMRTGKARSGMPRTG